MSADICLERENTLSVCLSFSLIGFRYDMKYNVNVMNWCSDNCGLTALIPLTLTVCPYIALSAEAVEHADYTYAEGVNSKECSGYET